MAGQGAGSGGTVVALAGRRIDAEGAEPPRFPLARAPEVRRLVADELRALEARALVCSAACGADLVALEAAEALRLRRRIVLPFGRTAFLRSSVVDRPGNWEALYNHLIDAAEASGDLVVLDAGEGAAAYAAANAAIVCEAQTLAAVMAAARRVALVVWEGAPRGEDDATEGFRRLAVAAGFECGSVPTL
jgi:hypothetical protein